MAIPPLWRSYFESSSLFGAQLEFALDEALRLGRLSRGFAEGFWFGSDGPLPVGVVFFPSLPFIGVMLLPSFVLGNASGGSGVLIVPLSPFSPLLSSPSPSFSHSLFLSFSFSLPFFSFSFSLPFSFALFFFFFLRELLVLFISEM